MAFDKQFPAFPKTLTLFQENSLAPVFNSRPLVQSEEIQLAYILLSLLFLVFEGLFLGWGHPCHGGISFPRNVTPVPIGHGFGGSVSDVITPFPTYKELHNSNGRLVRF